MKNSDNILTPAKEDYLETIFRLSVNSKTVRLVDIAKIHSVSKATISNALVKLGQKGYIVYEKYKPVSLTQSGRQVASRTFDKHKLLMRFFIEALDVAPKEAEKAACEIEHSIGKSITAKLASFVKNIDALGLLKKSAQIKRDIASREAKSDFHCD